MKRVLMLSHCFGVRSINRSSRSNQGIKITDMKQNMEETIIPQAQQHCNVLKIVLAGPKDQHQNKTH